MIKMDAIWLATAKLIYPGTSPARLVSRGDIEQEVANLFRMNITPVMLTKHLVSWENRQSDRTNPSRGGSRNRYLFRTVEGLRPSRDGDFRLYKQRDGEHDGVDKTGRTHPRSCDVPDEYRYLIEWYQAKYRMT